MEPTGIILHILPTLLSQPLHQQITGTTVPPAQQTLLARPIDQRGHHHLAMLHRRHHLGKMRYCINYIYDII